MLHHNYQNTSSGYLTPINSEEQELQAHGLEEAYFRDRDKPAPYKPQAPSIPRVSPDPVQTVINVAKPAAVASAAISGIGVIVNVAIGVASAALQFINEYAMVIGGGVFAVSLLYSWAVSLKQDKAKKEQKFENENEQWEYYQRQEQGWRKRT